MGTNRYGATEAYLFDYGGTLDTGGQHWGRAIWQAYREAGVPVAEDDYRQAYVAVERTLGREPVIGRQFTFRETLSTKLRMQLDRLGCPAYHDRLLQQLYERTLQETAASRDVLCRLKATSPLALVSNFYGNLPVVLQEFRLDSLFSCVVESAAVGVRKPDAHIFLLAIEALGLQPGDVTVVGDSYTNDIVPAHQLGCKTVWLRGEQWSAEDIAYPVADHVIFKLVELL